MVYGEEISWGFEYANLVNASDARIIKDPVRANAYRLKNSDGQGVSWDAVLQPGVYTLEPSVDTYDAGAYYAVKPVEATFTVVQKSLYDMVFMVKLADGTGIDGAEVRVEGRSYLADGTGAARMILRADEEYEYSVRKVGYGVVQGTLAIPKRDHSMDIVLSPASLTVKYVAEPNGSIGGWARRSS